MGYYSEVVLCIHKDTLDADMILNPKCPVQLFTEEDKLFHYISKEDEYYLFEFNGKWYVGYPEIDKVMDYIQSLEESKYGFIRVGEDSGDVEELGEPWEFGYYTKTVIERE